MVKKEKLERFGSFIGIWDATKGEFAFDTYGMFDYKSGDFIIVGKASDDMENYIPCANEHNPRDVPRVKAERNVRVGHIYVYSSALAECGNGWQFANYDSIKFLNTNLEVKDLRNLIWTVME